MALCTACKNVDFTLFYDYGRAECRARQSGDHSMSPTEVTTGVAAFQNHHVDIIELEDCRKTQGCPLCKVIFTAFEERKNRDSVYHEDLKGRQIIMRGRRSHGIEVCYQTSEAKGREFAAICGLDIYMDAIQRDQYLNTLEITEESRPPVLRTMNKDPLSYDCINLARRWLTSCRDSHGDWCRWSGPQTSPQPPKRLIAVGHDPARIFLVETDDFIGDDRGKLEWLSLSYCWGEAEPSVKLTKDTINAMKKGDIPLGNFDATIRDAVHITRILGLPYIWIDSLCIAQDSGGAEWNQEASKMNDIYGGSVVTLIVADAKGVREGFLKERAGRELDYVHVSCPFWGNSGGTAAGGGAGPDLQLHLAREWDTSKDWAREHSIWATRGWTMQEGVLPNRLLYYTSSQMMWNCCREESFERGICRAPEDHGRDAKDLQSFLNFKRRLVALPLIRASGAWQDVPRAYLFTMWYDIIEEYTPRRFKHISDRLVALSGIAQVFSKAIECEEYVAGLWRPDLLRGLMWYIPGAAVIAPQSGKSRFPSWSWISAGYEHIQNDWKDVIFYTALSDIQQVKVKLADQTQQFGSIVPEGGGCCITLTGPLKELNRLYNEDWRNLKHPMSDLERYLSQKIEMDGFPQDQGKVDQRYCSPSIGGHYAAVQMVEDGRGWLGLLILEATGEVSPSDKGSHIYQRLGVLRLDGYRNGYSPPFPMSRQLQDTLESIHVSGLGRGEDDAKGGEYSHNAFDEVRGEAWEVKSVTIV